MLAATSFIEGDTEAQTAFVGTLLEGVQAAGVGSVLPPDDDPVPVEFHYEDDRSEASRREIALSFGAVTCGYFAALGTRLRAGRRFDADDLAEVAPVILSETAARFVYPNEDPVGRPLPYGDIDALGIGRWAPVIAVEVSANGVGSSRRACPSGVNPKPRISREQQVHVPSTAAGPGPARWSTRSGSG